MFFGEFEYTIDEKGRVGIPPRFKKEIRDAVVVLTQGIEPCIIAYPFSEWNKLATSLTSSSVGRSKLRKLNRAIFGTAFRTPMDAKDRIALPVSLRQYAGIENEVVIVGANTYFELWNKEQWELEKSDSQEQAWQIIESLERQ